MTWHLTRDRSEKSILARGTPGTLRIDGAVACMTLEDPERHGADGALSADEKVPGDTAIPPGRYRVVLEMSAKFGRELPEIKGVPQFSEVKFHRGNTTRDTAGCPLVGLGRVGLVLTASRLAEELIVRRLREAGGACDLVVE